MISHQINTSDIPERPTGLNINERLGLISLIDEGMRFGSTGSPLMGDLFADLWDLVNSTVSGSKINSLKPHETGNGFRVFEINADSGENLGRLNLIYLKKPIPCYYLAYVEVAPPYRKKGLGNRILAHFRDFLIQKSAVGLLNNIIPKNDPAYDIYQKQAWEPIEEITGDPVGSMSDNYMVYIPPKLSGKVYKESIIRLVHHLRRKREVMDMMDNELMVKRTLTEFKQLYAALLSYFEPELQQGRSDALMRFMFTRFVTKFIAFRRRIGDLVGYTGGESTEQIILEPEIASLPMKSYAPFAIEQKPVFVLGDKALCLRLSSILGRQPSRAIESMPNYIRPSLLIWLKKRGMPLNHKLTIGDLMDMGFDPTRLKEIVIDGEAFIFERIQDRQLKEIANKKEQLGCLESKLKGIRVNSSRIEVNPPILAIKDHGNAYILRRKVKGIHWEEAIEQLRSLDTLSQLNRSMNVDRIIQRTIRNVNEQIAAEMKMEEAHLTEHFAGFVSWDLVENYPKLIVDCNKVFLESVWIA